MSEFTVNLEDRIVMTEDGELIPIAHMFCDKVATDDITKADAFIAGPDKDGFWRVFANPNIYETHISMH